MTAQANFNFDTAQAIGISDSVSAMLNPETLYFTQVALAEKAGMAQGVAGTIGQQTEERRKDATNTRRNDRASMMSTMAMVEELENSRYETPEWHNLVNNAHKFFLANVSPERRDRLNDHLSTAFDDQAEPEERSDATTGALAEYLEFFRSQPEYADMSDEDLLQLAKDIFVKEASQHLQNNKDLTADEADRQALAALERIISEEALGIEEVFSMAQIILQDNLKEDLSNSVSSTQRNFSELAKSEVIITLDYGYGENTHRTPIYIGSHLNEDGSKVETDGTGDPKYFSTNSDGSFFEIPPEYAIDTAAAGEIEQFIRETGFEFSDLEQATQEYFTQSYGITDTESMIAVINDPDREFSSHLAGGILGVPDANFTEIVGRAMLSARIESEQGAGQVFANASDEDLNAAIESNLRGTGRAQELSELRLQLASQKIELLEELIEEKDSLNNISETNEFLRSYITAKSAHIDSQIEELRTELKETYTSALDSVAEAQEAMDHAIDQIEMAQLNDPDGIGFGGGNLYGGNALDRALISPIYSPERELSYFYDQKEQAQTVVDALSPHVETFLSPEERAERSGELAHSFGEAGSLVTEPTNTPDAPENNANNNNDNTHTAGLTS